MGHLQPADLQRRAVERRRRGLHSELPEVGAVVEEPRWAVERIFRGLLLASTRLDSCRTFVFYRAQAGEQMSCSLLVYSGLPPNFRRQSATADPWPAGGVGRLGGLAAEIALPLAEQCGHPWTWEDIRLARLLKK